MFFNSIIPLPYYTPLFYFCVLLLVLLATLNIQIVSFKVFTAKITNIKAFVLTIAVILYMGLRPISGDYFGDMATYDRFFKYYKNGGVLLDNDLLWQYFMKFCSGIMSSNMFFLVCSIFYILPIYLATKKWESRNNYLLLLMFIASFSFWGAGVNGIRNSIAASLFLLAISFSKRKYFSYILLGISCLFHESMFLPSVIYIITLFFKNPKQYLIFWLLCIPISFFFSSFFENLFSIFGLSDRSSQYLIRDNFTGNDTNLGFRWDFLLYSASAVYAGYYFIIKRRFEDKIYTQLFNLYVATNAFWILVIRGNFSNRFAYLSWFMIAVVIFYPLLKKRFFNNNQKVLARIIFLYFGFTYFMYLIK